METNISANTREFVDSIQKTNEKVLLLVSIDQEGDSVARVREDLTSPHHIS